MDRFDTIKNKIAVWQATDKEKAFLEYLSEKS